MIITLMITLKKLETSLEAYFEKVRNITRGKSYDYCFPKSRKVTFKGGYPLGWVQISFN